MNKEEIIKIAKEIGTYEISTLPYGDCCSFFIAKHPELRADSELIEEYEKEFDLDSIIKEAIEKTRVLKL